MTVSYPHLPGLAGGGGGRVGRSGAGAGWPAAGTAVTSRRSPALPRPWGSLPLHPPPGRLPCRAWPVPGLARATPPPTHTWLQVSAPGFSGVSGPGGLAASCFLSCPRSCVSAPPHELSDLGGGHVSAPPQHVPGCPWLAARTPPSPPRGVVDCPPPGSDPRPPQRALASPQPRLGLLRVGVGRPGSPLVLPESGA